jgi:signal peptidase I
MEDTLLVGDRVVVSKLTPGPFALHRGDVVVFKDPGGWLPAPTEPEDSGVRRLLRETMTFVGLLPQDMGEHLIKRVIGLGGDTVACCDAQGRLTVNDVPINEPYIYPGDVPSTTEFSVTVPADALWLMGDHRSVSKDSRYNERQFVPLDHVIGKAFVVVWPLDRFGGVRGAGPAFAAVPDRSP